MCVLVFKVYIFLAILILAETWMPVVAHSDGGFTVQCLPIWSQTYFAFLKKKQKANSVPSFYVFPSAHGCDCDVERWCCWVVLNVAGPEGTIQEETADSATMMQILPFFFFDWPVSQKEEELLSCTPGEDPQGQNWCLWLHPQLSNKARLNSLDLGLWGPRILAHSTHT